MDIRKQLLRYADNGKGLDMLNYKLVFRAIDEIEEEEENDIQTFIVGLIDTGIAPVDDESKIHS